MPYTEDSSELSRSVREIHMAIDSLKEELEAIDYYNQRAGICEDPELREILEHNRDEEIEHSAMLIEWMRRKMPGWQENLQTYLHASGSIAAAEEEAMGKSSENSSASGKGAESQSGGPSDGSLGVGSLKGNQNQ